MPSLPEKYSALIEEGAATKTLMDIINCDHVLSCQAG